MVVNLQSETTDTEQKYRLGSLNVAETKKGS